MTNEFNRHYTKEQLCRTLRNGEVTEWQLGNTGLIIQQYNDSKGIYVFLDGEIILNYYTRHHSLDTAYDEYDYRYVMCPGTTLKSLHLWKLDEENKLTILLNDDLTISQIYDIAKIYPTTDVNAISYSYYEALEPKWSFKSYKIEPREPYNMADEMSDTEIKVLTGEKE